MSSVSKMLFRAVSLSVLLSSGSAMAIEAPVNAGIDWRGPDGSTALQWAVYEGDVDRVKQLIKAGADVNVANNYGALPMQLAAEVANLEMLEILLKAGANVDSASQEGQTALMLVARTGNVEAAKLLAKHGANINAIEQWGQQSALMWASARRHAAMMEELIQQGADINAQSIARDYKRHVTKEGRAKSLDSGGFTPLLYAIRENCKECVDVLIKHQVDLDKPDPEGVSPLLLSIQNSHWDIAKKLIIAGADVQQWDIFGQAPLIAIVTRHSNTRVNPGDPLNETSGTTVLELLLEHGANVNMQVFLRPSKQRGGSLSRGTTPLIAAADSGDTAIIKLLLEHGADATIVQADLQNPLTAIAGARGNPQTLVEGVNVLIAAGADINIRSVPHHLQRNRGGRPLHFAVRAGNEQVIEALVKAGADINATDVDGLTPLDHAMSRNQVGFLQMRRPANTKVADLLRSLGADQELDVTPYWPNIGPPFYYPWSIFPLDAADEARALVPGSFDHQ